MTEPKPTADPTPDPRADLEAAARKALADRPTPPTRTHLVRLCLPQVERCQALGWSSEDFVAVLGPLLPEGMTMTAVQFRGALRTAKAGAGPWAKGRKREPAPVPGPTKAADPTKPRKAGDWEIPELKPKRFKHDPSADKDVFD